jgi:hypothetical protein
MSCGWRAVEAEDGDDGDDGWSLTSGSSFAEPVTVVEACSVLTASGCAAEASSCVFAAPVCCGAGGSAGAGAGGGVGVDTGGAEGVSVVVVCVGAVSVVVPVGMGAVSDGSHVTSAPSTTTTVPAGWS